MYFYAIEFEPEVCVKTLCEIKHQLDQDEFLKLPRQVHFVNNANSWSKTRFCLALFVNESIKRSHEWEVLVYFFEAT